MLYCYHLVMTQVDQNLFLLANRLSNVFSILFMDCVMKLAVHYVQHCVSTLPVIVANILTV